jgi:hypothetical protein
VRISHWCSDALGRQLRDNETRARRPTRFTSRRIDLGRSFGSAVRPRKYKRGLRSFEARALSRSHRTSAKRAGALRKSCAPFVPAAAH